MQAASGGIAASSAIGPYTLAHNGQPVMTIDTAIARWITAIKTPFFSYTDTISRRNYLVDLARYERFAQASNPQLPVTATDAEALLYLGTQYDAPDAENTDHQLLGYLYYRLHQRYPDTASAPSNEAVDCYWQISQANLDRLLAIRTYLQNERDALSQALLNNLFEPTEADSEAYIDLYFVQLLDYMGGGIDDHGP